MSFSASDIESFRLQLQQVEVALTAAPDDEELLKLKADLEQLLALSSAIYQTDSPQPESATKWKIGQKCEAFYKGDGLFYPAKIESISADGKRVTVVYTQYGTVDEVAVTQVREVTAPQQVSKKNADKAEEIKKKKEKMEKKKQKLKELEEKRESEKKRWQDFNSKVIKKTKKKESMFATSEAGKVGVVGSGKGMTEFQVREKYVKSKISAPPQQ